MSSTQVRWSACVVDGGCRSIPINSDDFHARTMHVRRDGGVALFCFLASMCVE